MAISDAKQISITAGTTFAEAALYSGVTLDSSGNAVLPNTTDTSGTIIGTLYGVTSTTNSNGSQAVPVGYGPIVKVQMAASTLAAGDLAVAWGIIYSGSSGAAGRVVSVIRTGD
jgi:hypothetical protein